MNSSGIRLLGEGSPHNESVCTICFLANQKLMFITVAVTCTLKLFEVVHLDVYSPFSTTTFRDVQYYTRVIEIFMRYTSLSLNPNMKAETWISTNQSFQAQIDCVEYKFNWFLAMESRANTTITASNMSLMPVIPHTTLAITLVSSERPRRSGRLWLLSRNLVPSDGELHASRRPGDGSRCILTAITMHLVYAPSERHVCYTLRRGCSYAVAVYTTPGDVHAILRPIGTFHLSAVAIYRMPHSPHICFALRFCHILQYSLCFGYIACWGICFTIIVFYRSEIYSLIFTLCSTVPLVLHILCGSIIGLRCLFLLIHIHIVAILALIPVDITGDQLNPTMPSVLHILRWSIIGLRCFFLRLRIRIIALLALIPVDIAGSQVKPLSFSYGPSSTAGGGHGITHVAFITFIIIITAAPWRPEMKFIIHAIVVYRNVWVSASDLRLLKRHFGGQLLKQNSILNTRCFHTDHDGRGWVLFLLDLELDCT